MIDRNLFLHKTLSFFNAAMATIFILILSIVIISVSKTRRFKYVPTKDISVIFYHLPFFRFANVIVHNKSKIYCSVPCLYCALIFLACSLSAILSFNLAVIVTPLAMIVLSCNYFLSLLLPWSLECKLSISCIPCSYRLHIVTRIVSFCHLT